jgi:hypothetical protein
LTGLARIAKQTRLAGQAAGAGGCFGVHRRHLLILLAVFFFVQ